MCKLKLILDDVGDDLGVGFGEEVVALGDELVLEREIVFDDAVMHDDEGAGAIAVRVGVFFGGAAVGGPAGVSDSVSAVHGLVAEDSLKVAELAGRAAELEEIGRAVGCDAAGDGDAGGVITAIFEASQALHDDGDAGFRADVADDSTHIESVDHPIEPKSLDGDPERIEVRA